MSNSNSQDKNRIKNGHIPSFLSVCWCAYINNQPNSYVLLSIDKNASLRQMTKVIPLAIDYYNLYVCVYITVGAEYFQNIWFSKDVGAVYCYLSLYVYYWYEGTRHTPNRSIVLTCRLQ